MSTTGRNAPLSPVSLGGSEWSVGKYQPDDGSYPGPGRSNLASPPNSGGSSGVMSMNGFPSGPRSNGGPSPPPSIGGRMSNGSNLYARSESGRNSTRGDIDDGILHEHYIALRAYLNTRDPNQKQPPNKARDKLLRLSSVQFYELSTDVFDELIRRQALARAPPNAPNAPPAYLMPEKAFHPKRNQARQRLSSLGPPRFRDLAADVFHELERRFPRFVGSDIPRGNSSMSMRGPGGPGGPGGPNRTGTPVNGSGGYPPRGQSRRPSNASSLRGPPPGDPYGVPPSPGLPNGEFGRPMQKQLNQNNTIVPNKSTMVEEDDGAAEDEDAFGLDAGSGTRGSKTSGTSETDKKLIEDYQSQLRDLQEKLDGMEDMVKKKDDELNTVLDGERARATAANIEKQDFADMRLNLENKLAEAQSLNDSMKQELGRVREDHEQEIQQLRDQLAEAQLNQAPANMISGDDAMQRENEDLREELRTQQQIIDEVRGQAEDSLREMRQLSQQSSATYSKQVEMEKTVEQLEHEVREWKNRFARTKTQLRHLQTSSMSFDLEQDAAKLIREHGFVDDNGLIKDVHVTKFQIAIDELLQKARKETPETVTEAMKSVVVSVRRITRDLDEATPQNQDQRQAKLRARVSSTANGLITAARNFTASAGISPVSIIDAAASNLTAAVVELLRLVKIRITSADELEEEEGTVTPAESTGFFSPRSTTHGSQDTLPPPPPFQGLGGMRASAGSSAYSPISSPRESVDPYSRGMHSGYMGSNKDLPPNGYTLQDNRAEELKIYLEDQTALLVSDIQNLVSTIRGDAGIKELSAQINSINAIVGKIVARAQTNGHGPLVTRLGECRELLLEAVDSGRSLAQNGVEPGERDWKSWSQTLPPIAFEIARETKELVQYISQLVPTDDFS